MPQYHNIAPQHCPLTGQASQLSRYYMFYPPSSRPTSRLHSWRPRQNKDLAAKLTPSTPAVPSCYCLKHSAPYWSNPPFLISDIRTLWRSGLSARASECQKSKLVGYTSMAKCKALTGSAAKGLSCFAQQCFHSSIHNQFPHLFSNYLPSSADYTTLH